MLDQRPPFSYNAIRFRQRGPSAPELVIFTAPAGEVLQWADVGELGPKSRGPQREQKKAKVRGIIGFLKADEKNTIPTAIVLAFPGGDAAFKAASGEHNVGLLTVNGRASIVDGQHRLYGIKEFDQKMAVPVVALLQADDVERAFQFLVINNKSTRVAATHTKALLARMENTPLPKRLRGAKLAFDSEGIKDVDLVNSDPESPFYQSIAWTTTPTEDRLIQATAIEGSLKYLGALGIAELEDRDVRRSVFLAMWRVIKREYASLWTRNSRLISKVGIVVLTRFIADRISSWSDSEDLDIDVTDLEEIETQTAKIVKYMDTRFWTAPWAEKAQGGFDTKQGRERVLTALTQLYRNGRRQIEWHEDIEIVEQPEAPT